MAKFTKKVAAPAPKAVNIPWAAIIKAFSVLASLVPVVTAFIKELETSDATGADKKNAALAFVEALLRGGSAYTSQITEDVIQAVMMFIGPMIDGIVAAYNAIGDFIHKGK